MTMAALNLLAFAWRAAFDLLEPHWRAARQAAAKRSGFFAHILTAYAIFPSWQAFLEAVATFTIPPDLIKVRDSPGTPIRNLVLGPLRLGWLNSMTTINALS
jgi:hypothetical protein